MEFFFSMASKPITFAELEPVLSQTEKSCTASNYRQFFTYIKKNHKINTSLLSRALGSDKTGFYLSF